MSQHLRPFWLMTLFHTKLRMPLYFARALFAFKRKTETISSADILSKKLYFTNIENGNKGRQKPPPKPITPTYLWTHVWGAWFLMGFLLASCLNFFPIRKILGSNYVFKKNEKATPQSLLKDVCISFFLYRGKKMW